MSEQLEREIADLREQLAVMTRRAVLAEQGTPSWHRGYGERWENTAAGREGLMNHPGFTTYADER